MIGETLAGGEGIGVMWNSLGGIAENYAKTTIQTFASNSLNVAEQVAVGGRNLDFLVQGTEEAAFVEAKYALPRAAGSSLTRLVNQVNAGIASGRQVALWSLAEPGPAQIRLVMEALGENATRVQFINGPAGLYQWLALFFGAL